MVKAGFEISVHHIGAVAVQRGCYHTGIELVLCLFCNHITELTHCPPEIRVELIRVVDVTWVADPNQAGVYSYDA